MKLLCVAFVVLFFASNAFGRSVNEDQTLQRERRGVLDGIVGTLTCPKVFSGAKQCAEELDEKVKGREDDDSQDMKCCSYAEYRRCVESFAKKECGKDAGDVVNSIVKGVQSGITFSKCEDYTWSSPTCIAVIWFNYLVVGAIVLMLISVGCCLGSCCCRR